MNNTVCCPHDLLGLQETTKIFLAGPIQGAPEWQHEMPLIPGVTWISPRRESYDGFDYDSQTTWETQGLRMSDAVLFWIPEPAEDIPGRGYAQTTRIEFGEQLARGKKLFVGIWPGYNGRQYFENKLQEYSAEPLRSTLSECLTDIQDWLDSREPGIFFTSDTHFGSDRALGLSRRPFRSVQDMDWTMIERWNSKVPAGSIVYHLGDFGTPWPVQYLNGDIKLLYGNYERSGKVEIPDVDRIQTELKPVRLTFQDGTELWVSHEPLVSKYMKGFKLFGHIHGRQRVKPWGGLDVGVDGNNFEPVSMDEVKFYREAIEKYYDQEVWS